MYKNGYRETWRIRERPMSKADERLATILVLIVIGLFVVAVGSLFFMPLR